MVPFEILSAFFLASVLLALSPGPDNLFVVTQSALRGRRAGLIITAGLCSGLIFHTLAVTLGVAAIFKTSAVAFNLLKYAGAAYLIYLAFGAFRAGVAKSGTVEAVAPASVLLTKRGNLFVRGLVMNITNPKVSIFFLAFLPQFSDVAHGPVGLQMVQLGATFMVAAFLVMGGFALLAGGVGEKFMSSARGQKIMNIVAGSVFSLLALKLATSER